jgi:hypothetical protein
MEEASRTYTKEIYQCQLCQEQTQLTAGSRSGGSATDCTDTL